MHLQSEEASFEKLECRLIYILIDNINNNNNIGNNNNINNNNIIIIIIIIL